MEKQSYLSKSRYLLLFLFALIVGSGTAWGDTLTENFDGDLPTGWSVVGATHGSDRARNDSGKSIYTSSKSSPSSYYLVTEELEGSVTFYWRTYGTGSGSVNGQVIIYEYSGSVGSQIAATATMKSSTWTSATLSLGDYKGQVAIGLLYACIDDLTYTQMEAVSGPGFAVKDGSSTLTSPYAYSFGLATAGTTKVFTLSNPGTEATPIAVDVTGANGFTAAVEGNATSIPAGGQKTLTITMPDATASGSIVVTPTGAGLSAFTFNVSGTVRDPNKVYETLSSKPDGWNTTGTWSYNSSGATTTAWYLSNDARIYTPKLIVAEGEKFIFEVKGNYDGYHAVQLEYSTDATTWTASETSVTVTSDWQTVEISDIPAGNYYIALHTAYSTVRNFYGGELPKVAKMVVIQPATLDFGLFDKDATPAPTKTFTIANTGTATLNGINVSSGNAAFTITNAPTSLAAGASQTVTITMATGTTGALSSLITVSATDMNDVKFTVTGVVMPAGVEVVDFNDNKLPSGWGNNASNKWSFSDGKAYCTSAAELTTPQLLFEVGDFFIIKATSYDDYDENYIEITGSSDGTTWTLFDSKKFISRSQIPYGSYANLVVTGIPTTCKYLKFKGYYVRIDEIVGLKLSNDAPVLGYYTDEACTAAATATVAKNFDFVTEAPDAQVYYIKNDGSGTMSISLGDIPTGFTAALGKASLTDGEKTTLTINMPTETKGYHNGNIVVTAKNSSDESIGTFTVTATGVVIEEGKLNVNFKNAVDQRPTGWTGWNVTTGDNGYIYSGASSSNLLTTTLTAAAGGEKLVIAASGDKNSYSYPALKVYTKTGDADWSDATDLTANLISTSTWYTLAIDVPEGDNLIKFEGKNVYIQRIYGLTAVAVPFMETTAADIAFGMQTEESAEQTFTISNTGEATLTGLSVTLGKTGDDAEYSIRMTDSEDAAFSSTTLAAGASITVHVKQLFDVNNVGAKSDVLTISADGQTTKTINLTGTTRDPSILYVDFDDPNAFPARWQVGANWSVYTYGSDRYAYQSSSSTPSALVTTPLKMETGKTLSFKVARNSSGYGYTTSLKTRYSRNGGATWSDYAAQYGSGSEIEAGSGYTTINLTDTDLPTGDLIFEFLGNNIKLDMIQGLKLATAPALALTESDAAVVNGSTKAFENLKAEGTATYTLKNIGNDNMVSTVAITGGASVTISGEGEGVTISDKTVTLAVGKSATITLTVPFEAPYSDMSGAMTIATEGWVGDFAVNYTATLVDPTNFVEDFISGKPAGWYLDTWSVSNGEASINVGTAKAMITEKIGAEEGKNTLSFDTKQAYDYGYGTYTLNVYTSTDRKNWTVAKAVTLTVDVQTITLDALADGNYYVKFEAANAIVDNITGMKKLDAPARDLYVTATSFPATTMKGNSATITATVTSLIAAETAETGVYAKLFINGEVEQTADAQDIALNGTKTFSFTYAIPENKTAQIKVYYSDDTEAFATAVNNMKVNYTLSQTSSEAIETGTYNVTLQRTYIDGWNTICLPFAMNSSAISEKFGANAKVFAFDSYSDVSGLHFETVSAMDAGKPYLIYIPSGASLGNLTFNDTEITEATAGSVEQTVTFQGTYSPKAAGTLTGKHVLNTSGKLAKATASASMKGFRAYFDAPASARMLISIDGETTGIASITVDGELKMESVYNLNGQKVQNAKKGLYIVNGKKVVIK